MTQENATRAEQKHGEAIWIALCDGTPALYAPRFTTAQAVTWLMDCDQSRLGGKFPAGKSTLEQLVPLVLRRIMAEQEEPQILQFRKNIWKLV